jgi:CDP-diacylglycerol---serine O-phosphatidyltransferase
MFAVFPTLLTLGNAACGFGAITFAAKVGPDPAGEHDLFLSAVLIFLAMLFDMLDGSVARWAKQTSEFGAQLDSLCDAVSFGVAPAFLMLRIIHSMESATDPNALQLGPHFQPFFTYWSRLLWVIGALFALCAVLRLARFNVETDEDDSHNYFSGLPSPAAAATVASFPIALKELRERALAPGGPGQAIAEWLIPVIHLALPLITLAVAILMVSRFKYAHVFNQVRGQRSRLHVIQIVFLLAIVFLLREAMPLLFCVFAFTPPVRSAWREVTGRRIYKSTEPEPPVRI